MKKVLLLSLLIAVFITNNIAQVAINTTGADPSASAILDLSSDSKGLLIPRMTTNSRTSNVSTVAGLLVYDTDTDSFWYYDTQWIEIVKGSALNINSLTDGISNGTSVFLGNGSGVVDDGSNNSNTGIGYQVLASNVSGWNNVAVGYHSSYNSTTAKKNTANGSYSLNDNTTGSYNSAYGYASLYYNTTGQSNVAIGTNSLFRNTNRSNLVAIGDSALHNNGVGATGDTEATANVAIGSKALFSNTTGNYNVGIGPEAMYHISTGSENTAVGYQAGWGNYGYGAYITGCVSIGHQAGRGNTTSNKLFIDNSSTLYPLIGGDFSTDQVDINGSIKITGGTPGTGKVLTSDANGLASWGTAGASEFGDLSDAKHNSTSYYLGNLAGSTDDNNSNNNLGFGDGALRYTSNADSNIAIGNYSQYLNIGNGNISIGAGSMYNNRVGEKNTIIGNKAGYGWGGDSYSGCVLIGYHAGNANGSNNKLFIDNSSTSTPLIGGDFSTNQLDINGSIKITGGSPGTGKVLTSSNDDGLAVWGTLSPGVQELNDLADAIWDGSSIFIGDQVGTNDDGGNYNTALGDEAFKSNTTGNHNTAIGYKAMEVSNGINNSVFGLSALRQNTTGGSNTIVGMEALYYNQTGSNNTALGYEAGKGSSGNSISGCVFIGNQAGKSNTASNKLFIDNSSTATPLIGGDFNTDVLYFNTTKVGIGTDSPNEHLEVSSPTGSYGRLVVTDGGGSSRNALLFVSPTPSSQYSRIESYNYGTSSGLPLRINTTGDGDVMFGGNVLPENHRVENLGASGNAWNNVYADDYITEGSAAFSNISVCKQLISFPPMEKKEGSFDEFTNKGLKELEPSSLPEALREGNSLLIDEMTTYNYKANYEQQQQIEILKAENSELKARLDRLEKLLNQR